VSSQTQRVAVLHDPVGPHPGLDELDTLAQVEAVAAALLQLGRQPLRVVFAANLADLRQQLAALKVTGVFNLVESVDGSARLLHVAPAFLEHLGLWFTGSGAAAMLLSSDKLLAKAQLAAHGVMTPAWRIAGRGCVAPGRYIVKSVHEHASRGLDAASVLEVSHAEELDAAIAAKTAACGGEWFAEQYLSGREFNVSLLEVPKDLDGSTQNWANCVRTLPPAEILFHGFSAERPQIVDYRAKWDETSAEYANTPRCFDLGPESETLGPKLTAAALATWRAFGLRGYGRVDFRLDEEGEVHVIDVNANPCLTPDAGFAAALAAASLSYEQAIGYILDAAQALSGGERVHVPTGTGLS